MRIGFSESDINHHNASAAPDPGDIMLEISGKLPTLADAVTTTLHHVAPAFLEVGDRLQAVHSAVTALVNLTMATEKLLGDESGERAFLPRIHTLTERSLQDLTHRQQLMADNMHQLELLAQRISGLEEGTESLKQIAKRLRVINIYFGVESSRTVEAEKNFAAFLEQMELLVTQVFAIRDNIRNNISDVEKRQREVHSTLSSEMTRLHDLRTAAEQTVHSATEEIAHIAQRTKADMEETSIHLQQIMSGVGQVVMALQFHDITRQQIEHIVEALREQTAVPADAAQIGHMLTVLRIQLAQLTQVVDSITAAEAASMTAFHAINEEIAGLGNMADANTHGAAQETFSGSFSLLISALRNLNTVKEQEHIVYTRGQQAMMEASNATAVLARHIEDVREVNAEINLQALNAIVNAKHLGKEGQALSILAEEVMHLSDYCGSVVENIVNALNQVTAVVHTTDHTGGDDTESSVVEDLDAVVDEASTALSQYSDTAHEISRKAALVRGDVECIEQRLAFLNEFCARLQHQADILQDYVTRLEPWGHLAPSRDDLRQHIGRYTMDSERKVHQQITGVAKTSRSTPTTMPEDNFGDNVDLF